MAKKTQPDYFNCETVCINCNSLFGEIIEHTIKRHPDRVLADQGADTRISFSHQSCFYVETGKYCYYVYRGTGISALSEVELYYLQQNKTMIDSLFPAKTDEELRLYGNLVKLINVVDSLLRSKEENKLVEDVLF